MEISSVLSCLGCFVFSALCGKAGGIWHEKSDKDLSENRFGKEVTGKNDQLEKK